MIVPLRIFCGEPSHHGRPLVGDRQEDRPADLGGIATETGAVSIQPGAAVDGIADITARNWHHLRHFPTRSDLVVAVYRHPVEACAEAGPALLADSPTPFIALTRWIDLFVDFLVTKHGLAEALRSDNAAFEPLHA
jgi:hypothetical protein